MYWINNLPKNNWINYLIDQRPDVFFNNKKERKSQLSEIIDQLQTQINANHFGKAIDSLSLGLYLDKDIFFDELKSIGILRNSSYLTTKNPIIGFVEHLILYKDFFRFTDDQNILLKSLLNSRVFYDELRRLNNFINLELAKFKITHHLPNSSLSVKQSKFKALLAVNEVNFILDVHGDRSSADYGKYEFHSKEEISSAVSELIDRYEIEIGLQDFDLNVVDVDFAMGEPIRKLLTATCQFLTLKNIEIEVENFGYQFTYSDKRIKIQHPLEDFAKSMELSNIQYQFQQIANVFISYQRNAKATSLKDLAKAFHDARPDLFSYKSTPTPRYVLNVPYPLYGKLLGSQDLQLFREEIGIFHGIQNEMLITLDNAKEYTIRKELSYYNFLRLQRFFSVQAALCNEKFLELINSGKVEDVYRSVIGIFTIEKLKEVLQLICTPAQVDAFLDTLIWQPESEQSLDLQYTPIIQKGSHLIVPSTLIGRSNLARNIFVTEAKANNNLKAKQAEKHISIPAMLKHGFEKHGFITDQEVQVKYVGSQNESDIDFMAFKDGILFIAECKDSTFPTNAFEMRTPFSNFMKASSQINYLLSALSNKDYQKRFSEKHHLPEIKNIIPIIVASNNKMWGTSVNGICVRNIKELSAFLAHGTWTISDGDQIHVFQLWANKTFQIQDLIDFCSQNSAHKAMFDICAEVSDKITERIIKSSYSLNLLLFIEQMKKKFKYTVSKQTAPI